MQAGNLYQHVAFDKREEVDDGYGNTYGQFVEQFQRRANFKFLRGGETVLAARLGSVQPVSVTIRADSLTRSITADWRMRDRENVAYAIKAIAPSANRAWLEILVESGSAA